MGYKDKIPPEKMGNIKNLRFIHYTENLDKGSKITNESRNALRRINKITNESRNALRRIKRLKK
jgi:hypothetical protein